MLNFCSIIEELLSHIDSFLVSPDYTVTVVIIKGRLFTIFVSFLMTLVAVYHIETNTSVGE